MNTKLLLITSAVVMGAFGLLGSFLPHEVLIAAGIDPVGILPVLVQLLAASMFAFAMANWVARGSLLGGIYNRPVALGNLTHFVIGSLALTKLVIAGERHLGVLVLAAVYIAFALGFADVFFRSPMKSGNAE